MVLDGLPPMLTYTLQYLHYTGDFEVVYQCSGPGAATAFLHASDTLVEYTLDNRQRLLGVER